MKPSIFRFLARAATPLAILLSSGLLLSVLQASESESLTLAQAIARALEKHPALATYDADQRAAEARFLTALERPNPDLEVELEDVLGSGEYRDFQSAVYNLGVSQLLELGGKRRLRGKVAESDIEAESLRYEVARREVMRETATRYVAILTAQATEENARELVKIAKEAAESVSELEAGGRGSAIDVKRTDLERKQTQLQLELRKRESEAARRQLAAMWGANEPGFDRVSGKLENPGTDVSSLEGLRPGLEAHPSVALAEAGVVTAENSLTLERSKVTPDVAVGIAWRRDTAINDDAVVLNVSVPLPIWNRNEGGIAEAEAEIDRTQARVTQALTHLDLALSDAWGRLAAAHSEYRLVADDLLPAASELYDSLSESYRLGRTSYLELLDARRSLASLRRERIDALSKYHTARIEIEVLTGELSH